MAKPNKPRVSDMAKNFGVKGKEIIELMASFGVTLKSHMTTMEDNDLNILFDYYTQKFDDGSDVTAFFEEMKAAAKAKEPKEEKPEVTVDDAAIDEIVGEKIEKKVHYVDTRQSTVELDKIDDEVIEELVPVDVDQPVQKKEKIKKGKNRGGKQQKTEEPQKVQPKEKKKEKITVEIPPEISVGDFARLLGVSATEVIKKLMLLGIMASVSETIDFDTAQLIGDELGAVIVPEVIVTAEDLLFTEEEDKEEDLVPRSPIVVVMGHVDHGKTSLLDAIRETHVTDQEAGGITQHIGAYSVNVQDRTVTFLDTPGHEAFTAMRLRGAQVTDIAILVVAADDGIMPQTIEAINHAKAAEVSIIVAINKIDKDGANPERVKQELTEHGLVPEEWGGDVICVPVSAKEKTGIDQLLEMVLLTADMKELKANPNRLAKGTVIEAKLDKGRGPVASVVVQNGTLRTGDIVIAGLAEGRIRAMVNEKGERVTEAGPSTPVEILGLSDVPEGGDEFRAVTDEKAARQVVEERKQKIKDEAAKAQSKVSLDDLFNRMQAGEIKDLNIIIKADVQGSVEAVRQSLEKLSNEEVRVRVIHGAVGAINESDVMLATTSNAIIVGFNVRPDSGARASAELNHVDMRLYRVIYEAIEEIEAAMKGMLSPKFREVVLGHAEIRQTFKVSGVGTIAGTYVQDGKIERNSSVRIVRDGIVVHEGELDSLRRFKDDVKEVASGYECGMGFVRFNDIKEGDIVECFIMEEVTR